MIIGSIAFLLLTIFAAGHPLISDPIEFLTCADNETLRIETQAWSLPNGERGINVTYFCDNEAGIERSVTDAAALIQGGIFIALLFVGILFLIGGIARYGDKLEKQSWTQQLEAQLAGQTDTVNVDPKIKKLPPETREIVENVMNTVIAGVTDADMHSASLSERLEQLNEAYNNDLISKEEYDRVRQAILDSMDD